MNLDQRLVERFECIIQRNGGMGERRRIQDDAACRFARLLNPVDQFPFVIGLPENGLESMAFGPRRHHLADLAKCRAAINFRLALPQEVEGRPVEDIYG